MNRQEFLDALERELQNVSEKEREEALQYYREYFDEAGPENEEVVIRELGSPGRVAGMIRRDIGWQDDDGLVEDDSHEQLAVWEEESEAESKEKETASESGTSAYTSQGDDSSAYGSEAYANGQDDSSVYGSGAYANEQNGSSAYRNGTYTGGQNAGGQAAWQQEQSFGEKVKAFFSGDGKTIKIIAAIVLGIALLPVIMDVIGFLVGCVTAVVAVVACPLLIGISLIGAMIGIMIAVPFAGMVAGLYGVLCIEGVCLIIMGIGLLFTILGVYLLRAFLPFLWRETLKCIRWIGKSVQNI